MEIKKSEIAKSLLENFKELEDVNHRIKNTEKAVNEYRENALAMCEIANTLNNISI